MRAFFQSGVPSSSSSSFAPVITEANDSFNIIIMCVLTHRPLAALVAGVSLCCFLNLSPPPHAPALSIMGAEGAEAMYTVHRY